MKLRFPLLYFHFGLGMTSWSLETSLKPVTVHRQQAKSTHWALESFSMSLCLLLLRVGIALDTAQRLSDPKLLRNSRSRDWKTWVSAEKNTRHRGNWCECRYFTGMRPPLMCLCTKRGWDRW